MSFCTLDTVVVFPIKFPRLIEKRTKDLPWLESGVESGRRSKVGGDVRVERNAERERRRVEEGKNVRIADLEYQLLTTMLKLILAMVMAAAMWVASLCRQRPTLAPSLSRLIAAAVTRSPPKPVVMVVTTC